VICSQRDSVSECQWIGEQQSRRTHLHSPTPQVLLLTPPLLFGVHRRLFGMHLPRLPSAEQPARAQLSVPTQQRYTSSAPPQTPVPSQASPTRTQAREEQGGRRCAGTHAPTVPRNAGRADTSANPRQEEQTPLQTPGRKSRHLCKPQAGRADTSANPGTDFLGG
jgi:hypothetical protein